MQTEDKAMSHIEVIHTDHIKPAELKTLITDILEESQEQMRKDPERGVGWLLVNAAMALRKYNQILEDAYAQSLRETPAEVPNVFNIGETK
jgi:hypothetical protein